MKVIGIGAAGNKAVLNAVQLKAIEAKDCLMMNSTTKDFPKENEVVDALGNNIHIECALISSIGGCGKEREIGKDIMREYLSNRNVVAKLKDFVTENEDHVVIVTSIAGGTGSGGANLLGKFIHTDLFQEEGLVMDITIIGFRGFNEDLRERENTLNFLKEIDPEFTVQLIDNSSFMKSCDGNKVVAEKNANINFAIRLSLMAGRKIAPSSQNIDATDLYKLVTTPGYQQIEYAQLDTIKNKEAFQKAIKDMIDNSNGIETVPSCACFGIMLNVNPDTLNYFDFDYTYLKSVYGQTIETYIHIQYCDDVTDKYEWMAIIVSGLDLPVKYLQAVYQQYLQMDNEITTNKSKNEDFFAALGEIKTNAITPSMNRGRNRKGVSRRGTVVSKVLQEANEEPKPQRPVTNGNVTMNKPNMNEVLQDDTPTVKNTF